MLPGGIAPKNNHYSNIFITKNSICIYKNDMLDIICKNITLVSKTICQLDDRIIQHIRTRRHFCFSTELLSNPFSKLSLNHFSVTKIIYSSSSSK